MRVPQEDFLLEAIRAFDYPPVTFDFIQNREVVFVHMRDLDDYLRCRLNSTDIENLKDSLSGILYWGYYRVGYRDHRVRTFRAAITHEQLQDAVETIQVLTGTGLKSLKALTLPEFSQMAFVTKLRTFIDPDHWCVLDSKIASNRLRNVSSASQPLFPSRITMFKRMRGGLIRAARSPREYRPIRKPALSMLRGDYSAS